MMPVMTFPRGRPAPAWIQIVLGLILVAGPSARAAEDPGADVSSQVRAQVTARQQAVLAAEMDGRLVSLPFREGEAFRAGVILAAFDCSEPEARLAKAVAERTVALKQLQAKQRLAELQSAGVLEVEIAAANVEKEEAEVAYWRVRTGRCRVAAPFPGRVAERHVHEHDYVSGGDPLLRIVNDRNLELEMIVPSLWHRWLRPGTELTLHVDETDRDHPARVLLLGAEINPVSQTFKVTGEILERSGDLVPGMSGHVAFPAR